MSDVYFNFEQNNGKITKTQFPEDKAVKLKQKLLKQDPNRKVWIENIE